MICGVCCGMGCVCLFGGAGIKLIVGVVDCQFSSS